MINLLYSGDYYFRCRRKDGSIKWIEIVNNLVVLEGRSHALGTLLEGDSQYSSWYILLIGSDSTPVSGWTYANIGTDFTEFTNYDEATRVLWNSAGVVSASDTNAASPAEFTCTSGSNTIYGAAMVNYATKGDNSYGSGIELCATRFGTARPFAAAETIDVVYTINAGTS